MKHIRSKLMLAMLVIALLPVLPLAYIVRHVQQTSLEVGFNARVEDALEQAAGLSQLLFARHREAAIQQARELAASTMLRNAIRAGTTPAAAWPADFAGPGRIELLDARGQRLFAASRGDAVAAPQLAPEKIDAVLQQPTAGIVEHAAAPDYLIAQAPVFDDGNRIATVVVTRPLDPAFARASRNVVEVNQMFKTLGFVYDDIQSGFMLAFLLVYVPIALISVGAGYLLSKRLSTPLVELAAASERVAAGNWDERVATTATDEVGRLVKAFNTMLANLQEKQAQVIELEKMAVWREMARVLAHEIKNPLTPMQLMVQQLKDKFPDAAPDTRRFLDECTGIISDEIENLKKLVREFSEFARTPKLERRAGDLNALIRETVRLYTGIPIELALAGDLPKAHFDEAQMHRVLVNLLDNAVHAMQQQDDPRITITTSAAGKHVTLRFADTGTGISPDVAGKIFEPYFSTKKHGMGLGLAIVKRIIDEHGGKISVASAPGAGATFTIVLPQTGSNQAELPA